MNKLINNMEKESNVTETYNGAKSNKSTLNSCVDLFGSIGSMRSRSDKEVLSAFTKAYAQDPLTALKIVFFARDIRGGLGERKVFRTIIKYLADNYSDVVEKNLHLFSEYGRYDDLLVLIDTKTKDSVLKYIDTQLSEDIQNLEADSNQISLLGKWLPSENASSKETKRYAGIIRNYLNLSSKEYRKILSSLRAKIKIVEKAMCSKEWGSINYESVPSRAAMIYRKAFKNHDGVRYQKYLDDVASGKKEIKSSTLYPYDIVRNIIRTKYDFDGVKKGDFSFVEPDQTLNLQWDSLPNYVEPFNGLVIYDTSGSMGESDYYGGKNNNVRPIDVALSLAIYIAERNTGVWQNCAIPFSSGAELCRFKGSNIYEKLLNLDMTQYYGSTNLQAVFDLILDTAIDNKVSEDDMPKTLFVISDMQFDQACDSNKRSNFKQIQKKYRKSGYEMPNIVFWDVNAYCKDTPITVDDTGTCLVSGASPSILKSVLSGEVMTPEQIMFDTINTERYSKVVL